MQYLIAAGSFLLIVFFATLTSGMFILGAYAIRYAETHRLAAFWGVLTGIAAYNVSLIMRLLWGMLGEYPGIVAALFLGTATILAAMFLGIDFHVRGVEKRDRDAREIAAMFNHRAV